MVRFGKLAFLIVVALSLSLVAVAATASATPIHVGGSSVSSGGHAYGHDHAPGQEQDGAAVCGTPIHVGGS
jgi:hypothetical protein